MLLTFHGIAQPLRLEDCDGLAEIIRRVLHGWRIGQVAPGRGYSPEIVITRTKEGYSRTSPWLRAPSVYRDPVDAVCDFLVDLTKAYIAGNTSLLCLHCAAAVMGDGLVVFPSYYRAGKSTLAVCLAAGGVKLFGDDVLPIDTKTSQGIAAGILPRLRLPLPEDASEPFRRHVDGRQGPRSRKFLYVDPGPDLLAPFGSRAPIKAIVHLKRRQEGGSEPAVLTKTAKSELMKRAILQNFASDVPAVQIMEHIYRIVENADCHTLTYASAEDGARVLMDAFEETQSP